MIILLIVGLIFSLFCIAAYFGHRQSRIRLSPLPEGDFSGMGDALQSALCMRVMLGGDDPILADALKAGFSLDESLALADWYKNNYVPVAFTDILCMVQLIKMDKHPKS